MTVLIAVIFFLQLSVVAADIPRPANLPEDYSLRLKILESRENEQWSDFTTNSTNIVMVKINLVKKFSDSPKPKWKVVFSDPTARLYSTKEAFQNKYSKTIDWRFRFETLAVNATSNIFKAFSKANKIYEMITLNERKLYSNWTRVWTEGLLASKAHTESLDLSVSTHNETWLLTSLQAARPERLFYRVADDYNFTDAFFQHEEVQRLNMLLLSGVGSNGITDANFAKLNATHLRLGTVPQLTQDSVIHFLDPNNIPRQTYKQLEIQPAFQVNLSSWTANYRIESAFSSGWEKFVLYEPNGTTPLESVEHTYYDNRHTFAVLRV